MSIINTNKNFFKTFIFFAAATLLMMPLQQILSINNTYATAETLPSGTGHVVETKFLPVAGESIILRTYDNKYILLDTGSNDPDSREIIYDALRSLQGKDHVKIDYLIISHLDTDHYGNANKLLRNVIRDADSSTGQAEVKAPIDIENIVIKYEKENKGSEYASIIRNAIRGMSIENNIDIKIYTSSNVIKSISNNGGNIDITLDDDLNSDLSSNTYRNYFKNPDNLRILKSSSTTLDGSSELEVNDFQVGEYLKLYFFNTEDVYTGKTCQDGYIFSWTRSFNDANLARFNADGTLNMDSGNYYLYFDGDNYPHNTYKFATKPSSSKFDASNPMNQYWFAKIPDSNQRNSCKSNANSYGILAEVNNRNDNKYIYYANDMENNGYSVMPINGVYGNRAGQIFQDYNLNNSITVVGNEKRFTPSAPPENETDPSIIANYDLIQHQNQVNSETKVARAICKKLTGYIEGNNCASSDDQTIKDARNEILKSIVFYQRSHHGKNDAPEAINILNLNRSDSNYYTIAPLFGESVYNNNAVPFENIRASFYALSNVPESKQLHSGMTEYGVNCSIGFSGSTKCSALSVPRVYNHTISYQANSVEWYSDTCTITDYDGNFSCRVNIPSEIPTKEGYDFLGWADSPSSTAAQYTPGTYIDISGASGASKTVYAVFEEQGSVEPSEDYELSISTSGPITIDASLSGDQAMLGTDNVNIVSTCPYGYSFGFGSVSDSALYLLEDPQDPTSYDSNNKIETTTGTYNNPVPIIGEDYQGTWGVSFSSSTVQGNFFNPSNVSLTSENGTTDEGTNISVHYGVSITNSTIPGVYSYVGTQDNVEQYTLTYYLVPNVSCGGAQ